MTDKLDLYLWNLSVDLVGLEDTLETAARAPTSDPEMMIERVAMEMWDGITDVMQNYRELGYDYDAAFNLALPDKAPDILLDALVDHEWQLFGESDPTFWDERERDYVRYLRQLRDDLDDPEVDSDPWAVA